MKVLPNLAKIVRLSQLDLLGAAGNGAKKPAASRYPGG